MKNWVTLDLKQKKIRVSNLAKNSFSCNLPYFNFKVSCFNVNNCLAFEYYEKPLLFMMNNSLGRKLLLKMWSSVNKIFRLRELKIGALVHVCFVKNSGWNFMLSMRLVLLELK